MPMLRLVGMTLAFGVLVYGATWLAVRLFARWLIRDMEAKRAARAARAAKHKGNGRE